MKDSILVDMKDNVLVETLSSKVSEPKPDVSNLSRYLSMDPQPRTQSLNFGNGTYYVSVVTVYGSHLLTHYSHLVQAPSGKAPYSNAPTNIMPHYPQYYRGQHRRIDTETKPQTGHLTCIY